MNKNEIATLENNGVEIIKPEIGKIYEAIHGVNSEITAIAKDSKGVHGKCRSIDDTLNYIHPLFSKFNIIMKMGCITDSSVEWCFIGVDGSVFSTIVPTGDIKIAKFFDIGMLLSYTQRYAINSVFTIPVEERRLDDPETNSTGNPDPAPPKKTKTKQKPPPTQNPNPIPTQAELSLRWRRWLYPRVKSLFEIKDDKNVKSMLDRVVDVFEIRCGEKNLAFPDYMKSLENKIDGELFDLKALIEEDIQNETKNHQ